jgi:hypothetical protein
LEKVLVNTAKELLAVEPKTQGAVLSSKIGDKKRQQLLQLAQEKKIRVLNVKDITKSLEKIKSKFAEKKKVREDKLKEKCRKEEDKKKKALEKEKKEIAEKEKKSLETGVAPEKEAEKEEKTEQEKQKEMVDKLITKKQ